MAKINIVLDMSKYDLFLTCAERYRLRYELNKGSVGSVDALEKGTLAHVGNEFYYTGIKEGKRYEDNVNIALSKIREAGVTQSDLDASDVSRMVDVMEEYYDHWRVTDQSLQILEVEKPFLKLLHEDDDIRIYLSGKIDLLLSDNIYPSFPMDHKTFSRSWPTGRMSNQFKCYAWATESTQLIVNKIGLQKTLKPHEKFLRIPLSFDTAYIEDWKNNVIRNLMLYVQYHAEIGVQPHNFWPTNETSCEKYNRKCEYYEVCDSSGKEAKLWKMASNLVDIESWDVTKVLAKSSSILEKIEK